ncbi:hypothetical protein HY620_03140 [Candidatus Uhrbacteria bacterium]|nr:hypothetical protein [Candidatus Uhrbacteria bacterium]
MSKKPSRKERKILRKLDSLKSKKISVSAVLQDQSVEPEAPKGLSGTLTLFVTSSPQEPTLALRWCVDRTLLATLKEQDALHPHVLIVVALKSLQHEFGAMYSVVEAKILPLEQGMAYMQMRCAGEYRIAATVVWNRDYDLDEANADRFGIFHWLGRSGGFREDGLFHMSVRLRVGEAYVAWTVPEGVFAAEPPSWKRRWMRIWFSKPAKDECEYRSRWVIVFLIQPFVIGAWIPIRWCLGIVSMVVFSVVCGVVPWRYNFRAFIGPLGSISGIWSSLENEDSLYYQAWQWVKKVREKSRKQIKLEPELQISKFSYDYSLLENVACDMSWSLNKVPLLQRAQLIVWKMKARVCKPFQS